MTTTTSHPLMRPRAIALALAALAIAAVAIFASRAPAPSTTALTAVARVDASSARYAPFTPAGRYEVAFSTTTRAAPFGGTDAFTGSADLEAVVEIARQGEGLVTRVVSTERVDVRVRDQDVLGDAANTLTAGAVVVSPRDAGGRRALSREETLPLDAARLVQALLAELLVEESEIAMDGTRTERAPFGALSARVRASSCAEARCERTTSSTDVVALTGFDLAPLTATVTGETVARADDQGTLLSLARDFEVTARASDGADRFVLVESLVVTRVDTGSLARASTVALAPLAPSLEVVPTTARVDERLLADRVAGLTGADLARELDGARTSGKTADHERFLWRATGLLMAEPALVDDIAARYRSATGALHPYRALLLDLLTGAGTREAQGALVALLAHENTATDERRTLLFQRLALLRAPADETIAFARTHARDATSPYQRAAWIALGSAAAARARGDDAETAGALIEELTAIHASVDDTDGLVAATLALGNSRSVAARGPLLTRATDARPDVRHATAEALGKITDDVSRGALLALTNDTSAPVARRAFVSLRGHTLTDDDFMRVADDVRARRVQDGALAEAVTVAAASFRERRAAESVLTAILALDHVEDRHVQARIRQMMRR